MKPHLNLRFRGRRSHILSLTAVLVVAAMIFGIISLVFKQNPSKSAFAGNYSASEVIEAVNQERIKKNLSPLVVNEKLMNAAKNKVDDMIANNYFAHISPVDGKKWSTFIRNSGYDYIEAGENLANGFDNVPDLVTAWMNSPTHRDNILNPNVEETGVAVKSGFLDGYPTIFVAQTFGKRDTSAGENSAKANAQTTGSSTKQSPKKTEKKSPEKPSETQNQPIQDQSKLSNSSNSIDSDVKKPIIDKTKKLKDELVLPEIQNLNSVNVF